MARMFHTLAGVAMIDGAAAMASGDFEKTVYTGGYSASTKTYYWNTYEDPAINSVKMSDFDEKSKDLQEK